MATGVVAASLPGLKFRNPGLGFSKSMDFVRVRDLRTYKSGKRSLLVIRNSNSTSDIAELQPASEGSPLLDCGAAGYCNGTCNGCLDPTNKGSWPLGGSSGRRVRSLRLQIYNKDPVRSEVTIPIPSWLK